MDGRAGRINHGDGPLIDVIFLGRIKAQRFQIGGKQVSAIHLTINHLGPLGVGFAAD